MATSTITKVLVTILFLCLIIHGNGHCTLDDLKVTQSETGVWIKGKREWSVSITNQCTCTQLDVKLNCKGFQSRESIDPLVLRVFRDVCLLNNGNPIYDDAINFKYAADNPSPLNPISSIIACS